MPPVLMPVELHCHSTASDGTLSPEQLVALALRHGLEALAITDHDTTAGYQVAVEAARGYRLEVIPALEINAELDGLDVHILGYYVDPGYAPFQEVLRGLRDARLRRAREMVDRLAGLGVAVDLDRVLEISGGDSVGRPHLARALVEAGYVRDLSGAFHVYIGEGRPGFVPRRNLTPEEAVRYIRGASGVAVLAHPGLVGDDSVIEPLVVAGLQGLEAYYPQHLPMLQQHYVDLAGRLGLLVTGGSDYHGPEHGHKVDFGAVPLPVDVIRRLREAAGRGDGS